ncbi:50S ribosomal protein L27 [Candidatus Gracilibacteria bacterium]|nr:50S ribosomal protein L27 [Candidatus Gracilibacteria bacterium]NUJ98776.1 50S ribosomal protein L27 [Candidatus Gracilibacteria bacterium]
MAHKKAQGSTNNGRDSNAQRLGVKVYGGQKVVSGNIIVRQKGNKFWPANGVGQGNDFTLYAQAEGTVRFYERKRKRFDGRIYVDTYVTVE